MTRTAWTGSAQAPARNPRRQQCRPAGWALVVVVSAAAWLQGCAGGLELAAVGAAANAAQAGSTVYARGKINSAHLAPFDGVVLAAESAVDDLGLELEQRDESRHHRVELIARDETRAKYKIRIYRRTERLTRYQIDVGWFGHEALARLLLRRMQVHLTDYTLPDLKEMPPEELMHTAG